MKRIEIVISQSIEEDFFALCRKRNVGKSYSRINDVCGEGCQVPKMGTPVWPQLNNMLIIVCSDSEASEIAEIIIELRAEFPDDGVFCSVSDVQVI